MVRKPIIRTERGRNGLWFAVGRPGPKSTTIYQTGGYLRRRGAIRACLQLMEAPAGGPAGYRQYSPGWVTVR